MSAFGMLIAGILQVCVAPILIIGRRPIVDWLVTNVPPLDTARFHVRGELYLILGGCCGAISGGLFIGLAAAELVGRIH